jgi:hypothetical protein
MAKPTLVTIALSTALLGSVATVSWGYRPATATELSVIRRVVRKEWRSEATIPCPTGGSDTFHLDWAYVSTVDPRYALVEIKDSGCTYTTGYFLRRPSTHSERWTVVVRRLDSAQSCSEFTAHVPKRVVREFSIEGTRGNTGPVGLCVTPDVVEAAHIARTIPTTTPADRPAGRKETGAIQAAIRAYLPRCSTPGGRVVFRGAVISTANQRYAEGRVDDNMHTCYAFAFFLKRPTPHSERWTVIGEFPDSLVSCSSFHMLPEPVIRDFKLEGELPHGGIGKC